jgi:hypothetical protein
MKNDVNDVMRARQSHYIMHGCMTASNCLQTSQHSATMLLKQSSKAMQQYNP